MKRVISSTLSQKDQIIEQICVNYGLRPGTIEVQESYESSKGYLLSIDASNITLKQAKNLSEALQDVLDIVPE